jgi:hypothetical protein
MTVSGREVADLRRGEARRRPVRALLCGLGLVIWGAAQAAQGPPVRPIAAFPGLSGVFDEVSRRGGQSTPERAAAALFDFEQVIGAVAGPGSALDAHTFDEYRAAFRGGPPIAIPGDRGAVARDDVAFRLHSLGYSAKEIADVLAGRITRTALDTAQKMLMVGYKADQVSDFLDREYRRLAVARARRASPRGPSVAPLPGPAFAEQQVVAYAAVQRVDVTLVRAVIEVESGWHQEARSKVGAIGLMQLMPGTARELGVDPYDVRQNIEGGVRYLAWLLQLFKSVERALIAYNAGPGFADRYVRGQVALYGETREFVSNVLARLPR